MFFNLQSLFILVCPSDFRSPPRTQMLSEPAQTTYGCYRRGGFLAGPVQLFQRMMNTYWLQSECWWRSSVASPSKSLGTLPRRWDCLWGSRVNFTNIILIVGGLQKTSKTCKALDISNFKCHKAQRNLRENSVFEISCGCICGKQLFGVSPNFDHELQCCGFMCIYTFLVQPANIFDEPLFAKGDHLVNLRHLHTYNHKN